MELKLKPRERILHKLKNAEEVKLDYMETEYFIYLIEKELKKEKDYLKKHGY